MRQVFDDRNFDDEFIECPKCGWKGQGSDTHIIDFYGVASTKEIHCPGCDNYIAGLKSSTSKKDRNMDWGDELSNQLG